MEKENNKKNVLQLIANDSFITVNKLIAQDIGLDGAVLLGELVSEYLYHKNNGTLDEDKMFYSTVENITEKTTLSKYRQAEAMKKLKPYGITTIVKGIPARRFIKLDEDTFDNKLVKNSPTRSKKTDQQEVKKLASNNNIENNNIEKEHNTLSISNDIDKGQAQETFGNQEINNLFLKFEEIVGIKVSSKVKSNRFACKRLLQKHEPNVLEKVLYIVAQANNDRYAPTVTDFIELDQKWNRLGVWYNKRRGQDIVL